MAYVGVVVRVAQRLAVVLCLVGLSVSASARPGEPAIRVPVAVDPESRSASVKVEPGDHLWKIATAQLHGTLGREPSDAEVWPYWRDVIDINTGRLRSGDPDLIYPGEVIELP